MVVAVAKALEDGATARSSAPRPATPRRRPRPTAPRPGSRSIVVLPKGQIALGKLLQALDRRRAGRRDRRQLRPGAARSSAALAEQDDHPVTLVNSVNPFRLEGQKTAAFEICDDLGRAPGRARHPGRQRRQHQRLLGGLPRRTRRPGIVDATPRDAGASRPPARRRSSSAAGSTSRRRSRPRSGSATRRRGTKAIAARDESRRPHRRRHRRRDPRRLPRRWPGTRAIFCEPASAASVAGRAQGRGGRRARPRRARRRAS